MGNELLKVQGKLFEQRFEATWSSGSGEQPAADLPLDLVDGQGSVDLVAVSYTHLDVYKRQP